MTKAQFIAWLETIESTLPVSTWRLHGFHVWPLVRLQLFAANANATIIHDAVGGGAARNAMAVANTFAAWARAAAVDWRNSASATASADVVFLAYSAGTQPVVNGRHVNPLLGPYVDLARAAGKRVVVWEMCYDGSYNVPRAVSSAYIQPQLVSLRAASLLLHRTPAQLTPLDGFDDFLARVREAGLQNRYTGMASLERDAFFIRRTADWFRHRLALVNPSHAFVADYGPREQALCLACRELGVRTIEIQHGVVNETHPAYASWRALPNGGYETRPSVFWCWDGEAAATVNAWAGLPDSGTRAVAGGDPWREQWMRTDSPMVRALDEAIEREKRRAGGSKHVLVTLDPTGPVIPDVVLEAMRRAAPEWCFWVRLHPVGQRERMPEVVRLLTANKIKSALVASASQWPLHAVLRHMDAHVTPFWSTVVAEAEDFGVSSVACADRAAEVFPRLIERGSLVIANQADDLIGAIARQIDRRRDDAVGRRPDPARTMREVLSARPRAASTSPVPSSGSWLPGSTVH